MTEQEQNSQPAQQAPQEQPVSAPAPVSPAPMAPSGAPAPTPSPVSPAPHEGTTSNTERLWGMLSYIPLLAILALVLHPRSEYIKLHGRQGLLIFLALFFSVFIAVIPILGGVLLVLIHLAFYVLILMGMYQAFTGVWWHIPVLGEVAAMIPLEFFTVVTREAVMGGKSDPLAEKDQKIMQKEQAEKMADSSPKEPEKPANTP